MANKLIARGSIFLCNVFLYCLNGKNGLADHQEEHYQRGQNTSLPDFARVGQSGETFM